MYSINKRLTPPTKPAQKPKSGVFCKIAPNLAMNSSLVIASLAFKCTSSDSPGIVTKIKPANRSDTIAKKTQPKENACHIPKKFLLRGIFANDAASKYVSKANTIVVTAGLIRLAIKEFAAIIMPKAAIEIKDINAGRIFKNIAIAIFGSSKLCLITSLGFRNKLNTML